jgi:superfamily II DNA or RNA helicase
MSDLYIQSLNEVYIKIDCEAGIGRELQEFFTFFVPGYKFMPAFKNKHWDGKIRLFNVMSHTIYAGLLEDIKDFCRIREYSYEVDPILSSEEFSLDEAKKFIETLKLPFEPYDYQIKAFVNAVRNRRSLSISPTASGKSLIIYLLVQYYRERTLVIVPTTTLVHQLFDDFKDYGFDSEKYVYKLTEGADKKTKLPITLATWQSIYKEPKAFFDKYNLVIGDEAHTFKAKSLTSIMEKLYRCRFRHGLTGTLDDTLTNELVLKGLFGPKYIVTTTKEMMDSGKAAKLKIKAIVLEYADALRKWAKDNPTYEDEVKFLIGHEPRNRFIKNLALSVKGNTIILFRYVEGHGVPLYEAIKAEAGDRPVFFISGNVEGSERNEIRKMVEQEDNAIIVASTQTFGTGINIKNLPNIIFASPSKSRIKVLQAIGRVLRKSATKTKATLYDIADDLSYKKRKNHTIKHFIERVAMYAKEKFEYKLYNVSLKN